MTNKLILTESTKKALIKEFGNSINFDNEEALLETVKNSKNFIITIKENSIKIKQVLNG